MIPVKTKSLILQQSNNDINLDVKLSIKSS
jgi:hypothetical protein